MSCMFGLLGVSNGEFNKPATKFAHFDWTTLKFKFYLDGVKGGGGEG